MSICKQCGDYVDWKKEAGRWQCFNKTGEIHWDACSKRRWQQVKATGERFELVSQSGYANSVHGTKLDYDATPFSGKSVLSGLCRECVPPWEVCATCPDAI